MERLKALLLPETPRRNAPRETPTYAFQASVDRPVSPFSNTDKLEARHYAPCSLKLIRRRLVIAPLLDNDQRMIEMDRRDLPVFGA